MTDAAVRRLTLTLPRAASVHGARARAEDALRCAGDDPRLLLLRRLSLGVLPSGSGAATQAAWTTRTGAALRKAAAQAVHATDPGAAQADAVYFADALEAKSMLLELLAAGISPTGWFWRLAVPEWTGADWHLAAARLLPALVAHPGGAVAVARAVRRSLDAGRLIQLLSPVTHALAAALLPHLLPAVSLATTAVTQGAARDGGNEPAIRAAMPPGSPAREPASSHFVMGAREPIGPLPETISPAVAVARRVLAALPHPSRTALRAAVAARTDDDTVALWLAAQIVLADVPHLAGTPSLLTAASVAVQRHLAEQVSASPAAVTSHAPPRSAAAPQGIAPRPYVAEPPAAPLPRRQAKAPLGPPAAPSDGEQRSNGAGLLLLVGPLLRMGLAEWLTRHPHQAADGFAWALLRAIAVRMRIAQADPLWSVLPAEAPADKWIGAWRVGLDRWLRRRTAARLCDIVQRAGWLSLADGSIVARFRLCDADIRLRRHALDVDPGWVPSLGQTVRYAYSDHALGRARG